MILPVSRRAAPPVQPGLGFWAAIAAAAPSLLAAGGAVYSSEKEGKKAAAEQRTRIELARLEADAQVRAAQAAASQKSAPAGFAAAGGNTNWLLYGGIGLAAIIGGAMLMRPR